MKRRNLMGSDKADYSFLHTQQRMRERHGISMSREDYNRLNSGIVIGEEINIEEMAGTVQRIFMLDFRGFKKFVWDDKRGCVTTVLRR